MTKFCAGTILTSQVMDCQTRAIGKAIRSLFAEPVTITLFSRIKSPTVLEMLTPNTTATYLQKMEDLITKTFGNTLRAFTKTTTPLNDDDGNTVTTQF